MARRSNTFKAIALAAVRSGLAVQEVADSLNLARSALYAWVAQERDSDATGFNSPDGLLNRELAGMADEVATLTDATDLLEEHMAHVGRLVALIATLAGNSPENGDGLIP